MTNPNPARNQAGKQDGNLADGQGRQSSAAGRGRNARRVAAVAGLLLAAGCADGPQLPFLQAKDKPVTQSSSTRLVERDVEAPEVFQVTEAGLWDGRPSVGGVWVAHPGTKEPERVIIRNNANGQFVIGALFRREREIPGPRIQASSDAAAALGMLAGAPVELNVTALRREAVEDSPPGEALDASAAADTAEESDAALAAEAAAAVTATALDPAPAAAPAEAAAAAPVPAAAPAPPKPQASGLDKPYIQIGIFSIEANAERTADMMRGAGMVPSVLEQSSSGKTFWRVLVGPAQNKSERSQLLNSVKDTGFSDAYAVSN
ncbi:SPOR domain-containing protein [Cribrihabitans pelagius]|uniref:SPOR domain-containing protein n=1 Tax=Cribrihabitans pelagius TaxID=1765746 RepID=UPI003B591C91